MPPGLLCAVDSHLRTGAGKGRGREGERERDGGKRETVRKGEEEDEST